MDAQQRSLEFLQKQNNELKHENQQLRKNVNLPADPVLPLHGFGARLISLSVNLARTIGLRASERVLNLFRDWLEVDWKLPKWHTIRTWLLRFGMAQIADEASLDQADDWIWMSDHSNQIGQEKVLLILGVRASQLPEPGQALRHEDVHVLCIEPGTEWKREDVARVYRDLEKRFGTPRAILSDGAVELQESAETLENKGEIRSDVFRDAKHIAANIFKSVIGNDDRFQEFSSLLGKTRAQTQQTELAHLAPPPKKSKARFMNLAAHLHWAEMALWILKNPDATSEEDVSLERLEEKLGWLRDFESELVEWTECQRIISVAVKFGAEQGISIGATKILQKEIGDVLPAEAPQQVSQRLMAFWERSESKLQPGERLPISTEILESAFGRYKVLERQHSKGGFTSLIVGLPAMLRTATPESIRASFSNVTNADLKKWTKEKLGRTLTSKRIAAYAKYKNNKSRATIEKLNT